MNRRDPRSEPAQEARAHRRLRWRRPPAALHATAVASSTSSVEDFPAFWLTSWCRRPISATTVRSDTQTTPSTPRDRAHRDLGRRHRRQAPAFVRAMCPPTRTLRDGSTAPGRQRGADGYTEVYEQRASQALRLQPFTDVLGQRRQRRLEPHGAASSSPDPSLANARSVNRLTSSRRR